MDQVSSHPCTELCMHGTNNEVQGEYLWSGGLSMEAMLRTGTICGSRTWSGGPSVAWQATMVKPGGPPMPCLVWKGLHLWQPCILDHPYGCNTCRRWLERPIMGDHQWHDIYANHSANQDHRKLWSGGKWNTSVHALLSSRSVPATCSMITHPFTDGSNSGNSFYSCGPTLCKNKYLVTVAHRNPTTFELA